MKKAYTIPFNKLQCACVRNVSHFDLFLSATEIKMKNKTKKTPMNLASKKQGPNCGVPLLCDEIIYQENKTENGDWNKSK